jgi:hypothetical protein
MNPEMARIVTTFRIACKTKQRGKTLRQPENKLTTRLPALMIATPNVRPRVNIAIVKPPGSRLTTVQQ